MNPIGVFDSGVGGLSVLRAVRQRMPQEPAIFLADQGHVPYGPRPLEQVRLFAEDITRYLLYQGSKLIVVACNTASAAALYHLRSLFPEVPFVGMEPAVKPAAERTQTGVVGVLATPATFQGVLYASVVERFGHGVTLLTDTCPGLVAQIEAGRFQAPETRRILEDALNHAGAIDTVVLGCTHYPFVIPLIEEIAGRVCGSSILPRRRARSSAFSMPGVHCATLEAPKTRPLCGFYTTGDPDRLQELLPALLGEPGRWTGCAGDQLGWDVNKR
jgi:glutamate racemase